MIRQEKVNEIIKEYGSPMYVFDCDELVLRVRAIKEILDGIPLCYSIKANPFLIPALIDVVDRFEVCSPGELAICRELSVPPEKIIYSGVHKDLWDVEEALKYGVGIITAESVRHYELICEAALNHSGSGSDLTGKNIDVLLRLTSGNQFGMSRDDIDSILNRQDQHINITGLHYFAGTGRKSAKKHAKELEMLRDVMQDLRSRFGGSSLVSPMLEYGPGLPYPYFIDEDFSDTLLPLREIAEELHKTAGECELSVEMGRFIASSCGYYLTSICDIKRSAETNWIIVDGGINHVNYYGQMMGMKVPVVSHVRCSDSSGGSDPDSVAATSGIDNYCICGSLCTTNDILIRVLELSDPKIEDVLAFANTGAYSVTEAMGLFLSRTLPRIVTVSGGVPKLIRDGVETWKINLRDR